MESSRRVRAAAFAPGLFLGGAVAPVGRGVCSWRSRGARVAAVRACAGAPPPGSGSEDVSAAERTRAALAAEPPLVKFRRGVDARTEDDVAFEFTAGNSGGVDVWLVSSVLVFLVPFIFFAVGVATGYIDVTPR